MNLPDELAYLLRKVPALSRAYLVGGCVRDALLGIAHKDFDLEVYGVDYETLERGLSAHDQYLCIVPKQGEASNEPVLLPFEGDRTLSVILSKAFMLAADSKIKDPTIISQLKR
jgi:hypothetical protein